MVVDTSLRWDRMLVLIGYWHDEGYAASLPHPQCLVDPKWERDRRRRIVGYLKAGRTAIAYPGSSYCRFGCAEKGSVELTDGTWIWPEGLAHYVHMHKIRLPDEFVAHAASRRFKIPKMSAFRAPRESRGGEGATPQPLYDLTFWTTWCQQHAQFSYEANCYACGGSPRNVQPLRWIIDD